MWEEVKENREQTYKINGRFVVWGVGYAVHLITYFTVFMSPVEPFFEDVREVK